MTEIRLRVGGMACEGCAKSVAAAVNRLDPGATVAVDLPAKTVTITGTNQGVPGIEAAIEAAGYDILPPAAGPAG
jgi:copper chaperone